MSANPNNLNPMTQTDAKAEIYKDEGYRFMGAAFEAYNDHWHPTGGRIRA